MAGNTSFTYGPIESALPQQAPDGGRCISFFIFNTECDCTAYGADAAALDAALLALRDSCVHFEQVFSRTRTDSDIARAHAAAPDSVPVAPETAELVRLAQGYCEKSGGLFDITMGTITSLWDFHRHVVPGKPQLTRALPHVGYDKICLGDSAEAPTLAIADPKTILDLGGIAKGYIADKLAEGLAAHGVGRFVMNLGGNVLVRGGRPADEDARPPVHEGAPWRIGIVNPQDPAHHRAIVDLANGSMVTSGVHERRFSKGGKSYHHILSPRTGMPAESDVASATIVAPRSLDCDGYSTTAFMLGAKAAIDFIEEIPQVEAVIIDVNDNVLWTSGIAESLSLIPTLPKFF